MQCIISKGQQKVSKIDGDIIKGVREALKGEEEASKGDAEG